MRRLRTGSDRGAVAIIVCFAAVALFGMGALVIDVAALQQERRELQNGADAGALAIAKDCAAAVSTCTTAGGRATAELLANRNSNDSVSDVESVDLDTANSRVTVTTSTRESTGSAQVPYRLAGILNPANTGGTVHAQAHAVWDGIGAATTLPLTMSYCDFDAATDDGTHFATGPPFTGAAKTIYLHTGGGPGGGTTSGCESVAGHDADGDGSLPGGFGWLEEDGPCEADITAGGTAGAGPGVSAADSDCDFASLLNQTVLIPIYDDVNGLGGSNAEYHFKGFAGFYITGFRFPGVFSTPKPCSGSNSCIKGYFVSYSTTEGSTGGPNLGAQVAKLVP